MMQRTVRTLVAFVGLAVAAIGAQACPRNADKSLRGPAVGQNMVVNGLPVQIQQVSSAEPVETVIDRVERSWKEAGYDVKRQQLGPWTIVSALSEECLATLQLMSRGGSVGLFAIGQPAKAKAMVVKREIAFPPGAAVVSTVSGQDGPRVGVMTTLTWKGSVADTAAFFKRSLEGAGWSGVRTLGLRSPNSLKETAKVTGQRDGQIVQIAIFPAHDGTTAVISRADAL